jgi:hypothetical protein
MKAVRAAAMFVPIVLGVCAHPDMAAAGPGAGAEQDTWRPPPEQYKVGPLPNPLVSLRIGGKETWTGNPSVNFPAINYRRTGPTAPSKVLVGIAFLGQQIDDTDQAPLVLSASEGSIDIKRDLSFILFLFQAGKAQGEVYPPKAYEINMALFEAVPTPDPKRLTYGRQVSNPILVKLDLP